MTVRTQDVTLYDEDGISNLKVETDGSINVNADVNVEVSTGSDRFISDGEDPDIKAEVTSDKHLLTKDVKERDILFRILLELKEMNRHLRLITQEEIDDLDIDDRRK